MGRRITIIQGHPGRELTHLGHALADAYAKGAIAAGHHVERIEVGQLDFPLLREAADWKAPQVPAGLRAAQAAIGRADHLVVLFPLWTGTMPALLKGFLEHMVRPGFAFNPRPDGRGLAPALTGKTARLVVTMAMPAFLALPVFPQSLGLRSIKSSVFGFCGIKPVRTTCIGQVDAPGFKAGPWLAQMSELGRRAE